MQTETSLLKQHAAGERVDLLDGLALYYFVINFVVRFSF